VLFDSKIKLDNTVTWEETKIKKKIAGIISLGHLNDDILGSRPYKLRGIEDTAKKLFEALKALKAEPALVAEVPSGAVKKSKPKSKKPLPPRRPELDRAAKLN
jgi:hypothetical protein